MSTLSDMPDKVLVQIFKNVNFLDIISLKKVSKTFDLFFLGRAGDRFRINSVSLYGGRLRTTILELTTSMHRLLISFREESDEETSVSFGNKEPHVKNENIETVIQGTLEIVFKYVNRKLNLLAIGYPFEFRKEHCSEIVLNCLKSRRYLLEVKRFHIDCCDQNHIISILDYLDGVEEFKLRIDPLSDSNKHKSNKIDKIVRTEQWKQFMNVEISGVIYPPQLDSFRYIPNVNIAIGTLVIEELTNLKKLFVYSPQMKSFRIRFLVMDDLTLLRCFGPPDDMMGISNPKDEDREFWTFPISKFTRGVIEHRPSTPFKNISILIFRKYSIRKGEKRTRSQNPSHLRDRYRRLSE